jgi:hypothetical protein
MQPAIPLRTMKRQPKPRLARLPEIPTTEHHLADVWLAENKLA